MSNVEYFGHDTVPSKQSLATRALQLRYDLEINGVDPEEADKIVCESIYSQPPVAGESVQQIEQKEK